MTAISPHDAAVVLYYHREPGGYAPGGFEAKLIDAIAHADRHNRARLAIAYPGLCAAMTLAQDAPYGIDQLAAIAASAVTQ